MENLGLELESAYQCHRLQELYKLVHSDGFSIDSSDPLTIIVFLLNKRIQVPGELAGDLIPHLELMTKILYFYKVSIEQVIVSHKIYLSMDKLYKERHSWIMTADYSECRVTTI
jgi:hypothetical protein